MWFTRTGKSRWYALPDLPRAIPTKRAQIPLDFCRLDIAFPDEKIAIEVDGFAHHGKYLSDFKRDRERQNLLVLHGWRILRYFAGEIHQQPNILLEQIDSLLKK